MKLFEYQAKEVFKEAGIPIPEGHLINELSQLDDAVRQVGLPCVLKSQVLQGGRGKAGLIQLVETLDEAKDKAEEIFNSAYHVKQILVERAVNIEKELYLSVTVDPVDSKALIIACEEGGIDIEALAVTSPEKIIKEPIDINLGIQGFNSRNIAYNLGLDTPYAKQVIPIVQKLYTVFRKYDAELVEINPLFITQEGHVVAGDGKLIIDDNASYRQTTYEKTSAYYDNEVEYEAALEGIPYIQFDGDISLMCAGAGLTTTVYDLIHYAGGTVANYLEFGGPNYRKAEKAMSLCLKNESKVILIVTFGTIARADVMAEGVVNAIAKLKPDRPIVACIRGTNEEKAVELLQEAGLECLFDTEEAVQRAVEIAQGGMVS